MGTGHGHGHGHGHGVVDTSAQGLRALWISFTVLLVTAVAQAVLVAVTGSVALLGDTLHNAADALTAVPLGIAFLLGRRAATRRFTYGLGRAEDLAGLVIVAVIAASAVLAGWQAAQRLANPQDLDHAGWVAAAGVVGFAGNEWVARYRISVGRRIGSAALVADGLHARTDGFTSLAVVAAAGGGALGWRWVDPVVGLAIAAAIAVVVWGAAREVFARLLDAVDPDLVDQAERTLRATTGVRGVDWVRLRWVGHDLTAEVGVAVAADLTVSAAHTIADDARHRLADALPRLTRVTVQPTPTAPA
ncbi:cation diffusion facilitator family transporter [Actinophytocola xinjiangensis]|uniref:cation diffusion facilitator family transporter n=1 Tax=Actinophytocola xinjiangensis TaxID=485602 RepID=UPI000A03737E|nr:cation diffusion facilitator family transporter [Actinophytocola xinjiangensis]